VRRTFLLQALLALGLLLALVVVSGRVVRQIGPLAVDLGGRATHTLSPDTRALLAGLDRNLSLTYLVSPRDQMPSRLKRVEGEVRLLLEALRDAAPRHVEYRVIDPSSSGPAGAAYSARRRASPVRVASIERDEQGEAEVWSSLILALEGQPDILIQGIENDHLPHLEGLVLEHLRAQGQPIVPSFAVAAPPGYELLPRHLSQHGPVVEVDLTDARALPTDVDLLLWIQPERVTAAHIQALRRFLASGRSVVLAGSSLRESYSTGPDGDLRLSVATTGGAWSDLLEPFGLRPVPDLLLDRNTGPVSVPVVGEGPRRLEWPLHLRNLPAFRDFRRFRTPARGGLSFAAASPLEVDVGRALEAGFRPDVVATTTEHARVAPLPSAPLSKGDLAAGTPVAKQNLMVLLSPLDPWSGQVLVLASASALRDGTIGLPGYGHTVLLRDLVRTFCDTERLVRLRVDRQPPPALPPVGDTARVLWRVIVAATGSLLIGALGLWRLRRRTGISRPGISQPGAGARPARRRSRTLSPPARAMALTIAVAALVLSSGILPRFDRVAADWTRSGTNTPDPSLVADLARVSGDLRCTLVQSPASTLPTELKPVKGHLQVRLRAAGVDLQILHPEQATPAEIRSLGQVGLAPFAVERVVADTAVTTTVWSGLHLQLGQRQTVIPRLDGASVAHVDFLLAAALRRLETGRTPTVAVISDIPRLSPAEALEDYQRQGLSAPQGVDVYSRAKSLLSEYGYDVRHVSVRQPQLPRSPDLVIWFQPRRDAGPLIEQVSAYLAEGGKALVALQHFNIQQRQYRGAGFQTVYWPQPQFQDLNRYLALFGVEQVREVLMDRTRHHLQLDTQVNRSAVREYNPQQVALPFLIRAVPAHYDARSPLTAGLGDLLFVWGNHFAYDEAALAANGLRSQVLVTTSARSWSYNWQGGWLAPEVLADPWAADPGLANDTSRRLPLAVLFEGQLPRARLDTASSQALHAVDATASPPAWLCLVGSSEIFKNRGLNLPGFDHTQLLLNAVALATYGEDLARLQGRHPSSPGFAYLEPGAKARWRLVVIGLGPAAILGLGLCLQRLRRRRNPSPNSSPSPVPSPSPAQRELSGGSP